jgi:hypothetical protein
MNDLEKYFNQNTGNLCSKWQHYFEIYDRYFSRFRNTDVTIVEIGVYHGGSLQMWKHYFGLKAKIYGIDINPECQKLEENQIEIIIGSQDDRGFLESLKKRIPKIDILIDDGGHYPKQQINTFEVLFPHISKNGIYLCEDLQTSYWRKYGGGLKKRGTFVEFSKNLIDHLHAWHSDRDKKFKATDFTKSVYSLHYYDSVLVIEKRLISKPFAVQSGTPTLKTPKYHSPKTLTQFFNFIKNKKS